MGSLRGNRCYFKFSERANGSNGGFLDGSCAPPFHPSRQEGVGESISIDLEPSQKPFHTHCKILEIKKMATPDKATGNYTGGVIIIEKQPSMISRS